MSVCLRVCVLWHDEISDTGIIDFNRVYMFDCIDTLLCICHTIVLNYILNFCYMRLELLCTGMHAIDINSTIM